MATVEAEGPLDVRLQYVPDGFEPTPQQHAFLWLNRIEAFYGGAAGGGKSIALLAAALQYVDVPGYAALILRKTFTDLSQPGALIDVAHSWLDGTDATWDNTLHQWRFPSGASLTFGYLQAKNDRYRYQGAAFQFVGFDELTQFDEVDYRYLFSRLRKPDGLETGEALSDVPLRMRGAGNPGGRGHAWCHRRFILRRHDPDDPMDSPAKARRRVFIPAKLQDNPHLDQTAYLEALGLLGLEERARLLEGDWNVDLGDRYYAGNGVDAAVALGAEFDRLAAVGKMSPPQGGLLSVGLDHGDHSGWVILWPLEGGGVYVVAAGQMVGVEPGQRAHRLLSELGRVPAWPGLGPVNSALDLLEDVRYDAAGLESQRTVSVTLRRVRPDLQATKVAFGSYKREAMLYLRALLERREAGHRTQVVAFGGGAALLAEQVRNMLKDEKDAELTAKPSNEAPTEDQDHVHDALVAGLAPIARKNRARPRQ